MKKSYDAASICNNRCQCQWWFVKLLTVTNLWQSLLTVYFLSDVTKCFGRYQIDWKVRLTVRIFGQFLHISYLQLNYTWFYKGGECRCFAPSIKWFFWGESTLRSIRVPQMFLTLVHFGGNFLTVEQSRGGQNVDQILEQIDVAFTWNFWPWIKINF